MRIDPVCFISLGDTVVIDASMSGLQMPWLIGFIFVAEACVVTLSTMRTIFLAKGMKILAPILGFFEVTIWLFAIGQVMRNLDDFLGVMIEHKLALGSLVVRSITARETGPLVTELRAAGFGVTLLSGQGANGPVQVVFTIVPRRELNSVVAILKRFDPAVFYSVDSLQSAAAGIAPHRRPSLVPVGLWPTRLFNKV